MSKYDEVRCVECRGLVDNGRCLTCFSDAGCCAECGGQVNSRGRCLDFTCARFGLLPDQEEPRGHSAEYETEARAWTEYYRAVGNVEIVHETEGT